MWSLGVWSRSAAVELVAGVCGALRLSGGRRTSRVQHRRFRGRWIGLWSRRGLDLALMVRLMWVVCRAQRLRWCMHLELVVVHMMVIIQRITTMDGGGVVWLCCR